MAEQIDGRTKTAILKTLKLIGEIRVIITNTDPAIIKAQNNLMLACIDYEKMAERFGVSKECRK